MTLAPPPRSPRRRAPLAAWPLTPHPYRQATGYLDPRLPASALETRLAAQDDFIIWTPLAPAPAPALVIAECTEMEPCLASVDPRLIGVHSLIARLEMTVSLGGVAVRPFVLWTDDHTAPSAEADCLLSLLAPAPSAGRLVRGLRATYPLRPGPTPRTLIPHRPAGEMPAPPGFTGEPELWDPLRAAGCLVRRLREGITTSTFCAVWWVDAAGGEPRGWTEEKSLAEAVLTPHFASRQVPHRINELGGRLTYPFPQAALLDRDGTEGRVTLFTEVAVDVSRTLDVLARALVSPRLRGM